MNDAAFRRNAASGWRTHDRFRSGARDLGWLARRTPGWAARQIASNHFPMTTMPAETAALLMEAVG